MAAEWATSQVSPCPVMPEAVWRGGSAGRGRPGPASAPLQAHQPLEETVWVVVSQGVRCCLRPGRYHEVPCPLGERVWTARRGSPRRCLAAVLVEVLGEYVKARREKRGTEFRGYL